MLTLGGIWGTKCPGKMFVEHSESPGLSFLVRTIVAFLKWLFNVCFLACAVQMQLFSVG